MSVACSRRRRASKEAGVSTAASGVEAGVTNSALVILHELVSSSIAEALIDELVNGAKKESNRRSWSSS